MPKAEKSKESFNVLAKPLGVVYNEEKNVLSGEETGMNDKWLEFAIRIQSIAQAGLHYGKDVYDRERYAELRDIAAEMMAERTDTPLEKVKGLFCSDSG